MPGGYPGLEDKVFVRLGDTVSVVEYGQGAVAACPAGGGHVDVAGPRVPGVAEHLVERVLDVVDAGGSAPDAFDAGKAGEPGGQVSVGAFQASL